MRKVSCLLLIVAVAAAVWSGGCAPKPQPAATATAAPTPVLVDRVEQLLGTWHGLEADGMYQRFLPDGKLLVSQTLEGLDSAPAAELTYRLEGGRLTIVDVKVVSLPPCGAAEGVYEVELLSADRYKFKRIRDTCQGRARTTGQVHERVK